MVAPRFTYRDIRYACYMAMFERAKKIFETGKVVNVQEKSCVYTAIVKSTHDYEVTLSFDAIDRATCTCYMGERDELCKHVLALGLAVLALTGQATDDSGVSPTELAEVKLLVASGMRKIRAYIGPSKYWDKYENSLDAGSNIIMDAIHNLPASAENLRYLWSRVGRLTKKLEEGGVDDSSGIVGNCIFRIIDKCVEYVKQDEKLFSVVERFTFDDYVDCSFEAALHEALQKYRARTHAGLRE